jgi:glycosyltransferase involved in cell wall biosynthesis
MIRRVFYASGPGDVIDAHRSWKRGEDLDSQVSITFSSQIEEFCRDCGASAYFVSRHPRKDFLRDGQFILEHRPKPDARGARFHLIEIFYGLGLLYTAVRSRSDVALIESGCTHYFILSLFRITRIAVVPILHNTPWAHGFPPTKPVPRLVLWLDSLFFRWLATATIGVSPECEHQLVAMTQGRNRPIFQTRAQFQRDFFARIPPVPGHDVRPFRIIFVGRITAAKGVFDVLDIARKVDIRLPGQVRWDVCGTGQDFEELKRRHQDMGLNHTVVIHGWTSPLDQIQIYAQCHAAIVPTRSEFEEGLPMTAAEAVMAGRPVITNPVVPALEVLRSACVEAMTNDVESYVETVIKLCSDAEFYAQLCRACPEMAEQFYDRNLGLNAILKKALASYL